MLTGPDIVVAGLRALGFITVMQAAGTALLLSLVGSDLAATDRAMRRTMLASTAAALLLTVAEHVLGPARLTGSFAGIWDGSLQAILLASDAGAAHAVRIAGLLVVGWSAVTAHRFRDQLGLVGAVVVLASFGLMGHTATDDQRWLLSILLLLHLLIVAWWLGALVVFWLGSIRESIGTLGDVILEFSNVATWLVPVILVSGVVMAAILLPSLAALGSPYGLLLIAKLLGFIGLVSLAAWNKLRLAPAIARGEARALAAFRRVVAVEWTIIAIVLVSTSVMTGFFGPD